MASVAFERKKKESRKCRGEEEEKKIRKTRTKSGMAISSRSESFPWRRTAFTGDVTWRWEFPEELVTFCFSLFVRGGESDAYTLPLHLGIVFFNRRQKGKRPTKMRFRSFIYTYVFSSEGLD